MFVAFLFGIGCAIGLYFTLDNTWTEPAAWAANACADVPKNKTYHWYAFAKSMKSLVAPIGYLGLALQSSITGTIYDMKIEGSFMEIFTKPAVAGSIFVGIEVLLEKFADDTSNFWLWISVYYIGVSAVQGLLWFFVVPMLFSAIMPNFDMQFMAGSSRKSYNTTGLEEFTMPSI